MSMHDPYTTRLVELHDAIFRLGHDIVPVPGKPTLWQYDVERIFNDIVIILLHTKPFDYGVM